jgi:hypothetical protein
VVKRSLSSFDPVRDTLPRSPFVKLLGVRLLPRAEGTGSCYTFAAERAIEKNWHGGTAYRIRHESGAEWWYCEACVKPWLIEKGLLW